jgi:hypothetical protein
VQFSQILSSGITEFESQKKMNEIGIETDDINSIMSPLLIKKPVIETGDLPELFKNQI